MPSKPSNGCTKRYKGGWIAVGYCEEEDYWYSSEGVFNNGKAAIEDVERLYPVDFAYAVRVPLKQKKVRG